MSHFTTDYLLTGFLLAINRARDKFCHWTSLSIGDTLWEREREWSDAVKPNTLLSGWGRVPRQARTLTGRWQNRPPKKGGGNIIYGTYWLNTCQPSSGFHGEQVDLPHYGQEPNAPSQHRSACRERMGLLQGSHLSCPLKAVFAFRAQNPVWIQHDKHSIPVRSSINCMNLNCMNPYPLVIHS